VHNLDNIEYMCVCSQVRADIANNDTINFHSNQYTRGRLVIYNYIFLL